MRVFVIGHPVGHSKSPLMHNAAFQALGLRDWRYDLWDTPPERLSERVHTIRYSADIVGANVTVPHKQAIVPLLDALTPGAQRIGAVNTIVKRDGALIGDNTDWLGFLADLDHHGVSVNHETRALVIGAGGSARAVVYALHRRGAHVRIHNRTPARAAALADAFDARVRARADLSEASRRNTDRPLHLAGHVAANRHFALG